MNLEEMVSALPEEMKGNGGCPSKELHEDEAGYMLPDGTVAFDDQSGAPLKPGLMKKARREDIDYFKPMGFMTKYRSMNAGRRPARRP